MHRYLADDEIAELMQKIDLDYWTPDNVLAILFTDMPQYPPTHVSTDNCHDFIQLSINIFRTCSSKRE